MKKFMLPVFLVLACGCASQRVIPSPKLAAPTVAHSTPAQLPEVPTAPRPLESDLTIPMMIAVRAPKAHSWPDIPDNCTYTGVVLAHDRFSQPRRIRLENMCLIDEGLNAHLYAGPHLWVKADSRGHFPLPFHGVHLEEKANRLILAFTLDGVPVEEVLMAGRQPGTQSFEHAFGEYFILPVD